MTPENEVQNVLPCLARIIREQFIHILSVVSAKNISRVTGLL